MKNQIYFMLGIVLYILTFISCESTSTTIESTLTDYNGQWQLTGDVTKAIWIAQSPTEFMFDTLLFKTPKYEGVKAYLIQDSTSPSYRRYVSISLSLTNPNKLLGSATYNLRDSSRNQTINQTFEGTRIK